MVKAPSKTDGHPLTRQKSRCTLNFFLKPDGTMMAAPINGASRFDAGVPKAFFPAVHPSALTTNNLQYSVMRDGQRFLVNVRPQESSVVPLQVIVNWTATIRK